MSAPKCSEGDHINDDNPGEPVCATCEDWLSDQEQSDVRQYNEVTRFCPSCGEDLVGNDPCQPDCPTQSTPVVDSDLLGTCCDCGAPCHLHMRRCQWCAALKHLA